MLLLFVLFIEIWERNLKNWGLCIMILLCELIAFILQCSELLQ